MNIRYIFILLIFLSGYSFGQIKSNLRKKEKDGRWGVVNASKKIIVPFKYDYVEIYKDGYITASYESKFDIYDSTGNQISKEKFGSVGLYTIQQDYLYSNGACQVCLEYFNNCGLINTEGVTILPLEYKNIWEFKYDVVAVGKNSKWGFVNTKGQIVIPLEYDYVWDFSDSLAAVKKNGKIGFINLKNEVIIPLQYDGPYYPEFHEGLSAVQIGEKIAFINKLNQPITQFKYSPINCQLSPHYKDPHNYYHFSNGIAYVKDDDCNVGLIDTTGKEIVPMEYDFVWINNEGNISAKKDEVITIYKK